MLLGGCCSEDKSHEFYVRWGSRSFRAAGANLIKCMSVLSLLVAAGNFNNVIDGRSWRLKSCPQKNICIYKGWQWMWGSAYFAFRSPHHPLPPFYALFTTQVEETEICFWNFRTIEGGRSLAVGGFLKIKTLVHFSDIQLAIDAFSRGKNRFVPITFQFRSKFWLILRAGPNPTRSRETPSGKRIFALATSDLLRRWLRTTAALKEVAKLFRTTPQPISHRITA